MTNRTSVTLKVLKVDQPIGEFYIGAIDSKVLLSIATIDIRQFMNDRADDIGGIQRRLSKTRLKEIAQYVSFDFATFPTSIVLAVDERCAHLKPINGNDGLFELSIVPYASEMVDEESIPLEKAAFVIDGQHRLAGLEHLPRNRVFELNVSIFVGADLADKAEIFSTVNLAQTKVNRSLVYDLFSYAKRPSPFKTAHEIAIALDHDDQNGPFFERIKRLGVRTPGRRNEMLSQATIVRGILRHLPKNPSLERNKGFLGSISKREPGESWRQTIFANYYREGDSVSIFQTLTNYFSAVRNVWPTAWDSEEEGDILPRTNGFDALIRYLQDAYLEVVEQSPRVVETAEFEVIFSRMLANGVKASSFNTNNFPPGSSGSSHLYNVFRTERPR